MDPISLWNTLDVLTRENGLALLSGYYGVLGILACYGLHRLVLLARLSSKGAAASVEVPRGPATDLPPSELPLVTVQLPIFNERNVAVRLVRAACAMRYPRGRLEIQVLDDSTDETSTLIADEVTRLAALGHDLHHIRRSDRQGFKAGALEYGQKIAKGELLAIFDADFVPGADFLTRVVPSFQGTENQDVGMVQTRWGHLNRKSSVLTRAQAILLDGHFRVEHLSRFLAGCFFNFNGTAGVWRRQAIEEAGGWQHDTLTEDLDLSYRAQLSGWRFVYKDEISVPAELPASVHAFKSQQRRWARGSAQTCRKLLGRILTAPISLTRKAEAFIHLTGNMTYVLMVVLTLLMFPAMYARRSVLSEGGALSQKLLLIDIPLLFAATCAVAAFYIVAQRRSGQVSLTNHLIGMPAALALGVGLSLSNAIAVCHGLARMGGIFVRTPKQGEGAILPYRSSADWSLVLESLMVLYLATCFGFAVWLGMWWALPFQALFLSGFSLMAFLGWKETLKRGDRPRRSALLLVDDPAIDAGH